MANITEESLKNSFVIITENNDCLRFSDKHVVIYGDYESAKEDSIESDKKISSVYDLSEDLKKDAIESINFHC